MPFVHCEACGHHVVVDPGGICPEGHRTGVVTPRTRLGGGLAGGVDGGQVAASMGSPFDDPHADEPQPWIGRVEPDEVAEHHDPEPVGASRPIRPLSAPSEGPGDAPPAPEPPPAVDREAMLRELQALGGLGIDPAPGPEPRREPRPEPRLGEPSTNGAGGPDLRLVPDPAPTSSQEPPPSQEPPSPAPSTSPRRQRPAHDDEVASLEAMLSELANDRPAPPAAATPDNGRAPAHERAPAHAHASASRSTAPPPPPSTPPPAPAPPPPQPAGVASARPAPSAAPVGDAATGTFTARKGKRRRFGR